MGKDLTGEKFGKWTVLEKSREPGSSRRSLWVCRCECGTVKNVRSSSLMAGKSESCKKCVRKSTGTVSMIGERFGKWTVLEKSKKSGNYWVCRCECGTIKDVRDYYLMNGTRKACWACSHPKTDMIGSKFGKWTVLAKGGTDKRGVRLWSCRCEGCQTISEVNGQRLRRGGSSACKSCSAKECNILYREEERRFAERSGLPKETKYTCTKVWNTFAEVGLPATAENIANTLGIRIEATRDAIRCLVGEGLLDRVGLSRKKVFQLSLKSLKILEGRANENESV